MKPAGNLTVFAALAPYAARIGQSMATRAERLYPDGDDYVQEALLALWQICRYYDGVPSRAYLRKSVKRAIWAYRLHWEVGAGRRFIPGTSIPRQTLPPPCTSSLDRLLDEGHPVADAALSVSARPDARAELADEVAKVIATIPPEDRVWMLQVFDGARMADLTVSTGLSPRYLAERYRRIVDGSRAALGLTGPRPTNPNTNSGRGTGSHLGRSRRIAPGPRFEAVAVRGAEED